MNFYIIIIGNSDVRVRKHPDVQPFLYTIFVKNVGFYATIQYMTEFSTGIAVSANIKKYFILSLNLIK